MAARKSSKSTPAAASAAVQKSALRKVVAKATTAAAAATAPSRIPAPEPREVPVLMPDAGAEVDAEAVVPVAAHALKRKELLERVIKATGGKKKDARATVEATLAAIGDALSRGEDLILPPLGRAKVNRQRDNADGEVLIIKLRRGGKAGGGENQVKEGLAEPDEDD